MPSSSRCFRRQILFAHNISTRPRRRGNARWRFCARDLARPSIRHSVHPSIPFPPPVPISPRSPRPPVQRQSRKQKAESRNLPASFIRDLRGLLFTGKAESRKQKSLRALSPRSPRPPVHRQSRKWKAESRNLPAPSLRDLRVLLFTGKAESGKQKAEISLRPLSAISASSCSRAKQKVESRKQKSPCVLSLRSPRPPVHGQSRKRKAESRNLPAPSLCALRDLLFPRIRSLRPPRSPVPVLSLRPPRSPVPVLSLRPPVP